MTRMTMSAAPAWRETVVHGGLTVGVLDALDAVLFFGGVRGIPPARIPQHVAAGVLGSSSFQAGAASIALGVVMHFVVALCVAAVYWLVSQRLAVLASRPVVSGLVFGAAAYFVMQRIVVPLSRAPVAKGPTSFWVLVNGVVGHALLVGLPIALWAAASVGRRRVAAPASAATRRA
jgi:hypothetical protein